MNYRLLIIIVITVLQPQCFAQTLLSTNTDTSSYNLISYPMEQSLKIEDTSISGTVSINLVPGITPHVRNQLIATAKITLQNPIDFVSACVLYPDFGLVDPDNRGIRLALQYRGQNLTTDIDVVCDTDANEFQNNEVKIYVPEGIPSQGSHTLRVAVWIYAH